MSWPNDTSSAAVNRGASSRKPRLARTRKIPADRQCVAVSACKAVPCYHPLHGYRAKYENPETGKRSWVSKLSKAKDAERLSIPCGRCVGCRLERSRQWALRCVHEASLHEDNAFITLTYAPEHIPPGGTLIKKHFQDFVKRLRKHHEPRAVRYFHCGEYGDESKRPHYHGLLFGVAFADQTLFKRSASGEAIYTSEILSRLWPAGFCTTGAVTFESAAYVARYVMKKITGPDAAKHYQFTDPDTGEVHQRLPEYTTMSLKPAIAKNWYRDFKGDAYPSDFLVYRGKKMKPPKYYDRLLELEDPIAHAAIKARRTEEALLRQGDSTTARLAVREEVKLAQIKSLKRGLE